MLDSFIRKVSISSYGLVVYLVCRIKAKSRCDELESRLISTATTLNDRLDDVKAGVLLTHAFAH